MRMSAIVLARIESGRFSVVSYVAIIVCSCRRLFDLFRHDIGYLPFISWAFIEIGRLKPVHVHYITRVKGKRGLCNVP